ncbi:MAG: ribosome biogenesis GTP-binding protein YihA/YsxC [Endomicrobia bacterium]|nr:ribosome biogenesis GTP-binding protein YihA/YsxC [Endomicrobiia bacterium]
MLEKAVFFRAVSDAKSLPESISEVIFSGRSNVGKSSVINALCGRKNLARASKTPGRTRSINVYSVSKGRWLIDLPGYGFARVSPEEKKLWREMIENCILGGRGRKTVYVIIDAFVGPTELDEDMVVWLRESGVNFKIVANKCDKLPKEITADQLRAKAAGFFGVKEAEVFAVSAKKRNGFEALKTDVVSFLKG